MKQTRLSKLLIIIPVIIIVCLTFLSVPPALAESVENNLTVASTKNITTTGSLIELGNTTASKSLIVLRVTGQRQETEDLILSVDKKTKILRAGGGVSSLSDWLLGDQIRVIAAKDTYTGFLQALSLQNLSLTKDLTTINGWVTGLYPITNQMSITWQDKTLVLNTVSAQMIIGNKQTSLLTEFQTGDRVRARVKKSVDNVFNATRILTLRRLGKVLTPQNYWLISTNIYSLPTVSDFPAELTTRIQASPSYQQNDANNILGEPRSLITVLVTKTTKLLKQAKGQATLADFSEGDQLIILGRLTNHLGQLEALTIQNTNLNAANLWQGLVTITAIDLDHRLLSGQTSDNTLWTIRFNDDTQFYLNKDLVSIKTLSVGTIVRLRGLQNSRNKTMQAVKLSIIGQK